MLKFQTMWIFETEIGSSFFFLIFSFNLVKENVIFTPEIDGTILPGITRKSIIDIATDLGYKVLQLLVYILSILMLYIIFYQV